MDEFSESIGVTPEKFKEIAHGKWLLQAYISAVFEKISNLQKYCKTGKITRCRNCLIHNDKKLEECEYRSRINFMDNNLEQFLYTHAIRDTETEYIYQRIEQLGN